MSSPAATTLSRMAEEARRFRARRSRSTGSCPCRCRNAWSAGCGNFVEGLASATVRRWRSRRISRATHIHTANGSSTKCPESRSSPEFPRALCAPALQASERECRARRLKLCGGGYRRLPPEEPSIQEDRRPSGILAIERSLLHFLGGAGPRSPFDRLRKSLERSGILPRSQAGGRSGGRTLYSAGTSLAAPS